MHCTVCVLYNYAGFSQIGSHFLKAATISMQEYASCNMNSASSYMTTNHTHNNIHSCLSVCWLYMYVNCTLDPVSASNSVCVH